MKTFVDGRMMIAVSCVLILQGANGIVADGIGVSEIESSRKTNLRRALEFQQQQPQQHLRDVRLLTSTGTTRATEEFRDIEKKYDSSENDETEELEDIEKKFGGSENDETEELEDIEKEFGGSENDETEELEGIEKEFGGTESETEELEDIEKEFGGSENDETEELEDIEKEFGGSESETEELEDIEEEFGGDETGNEEEEASVAIEPTEVPEPENKPPIAAPTGNPTKKPYTKTNDDFDPVKAEDEKHAEEEEVQELETELKQEERVARQAGGLGIFLGILAMVFTAHQMSENPDGIYASVCRLAITLASVVVKIVCMPCRKLLGAGGDGNPYSGHMPISTSDYSYRTDPYRSNANAGFEMS